jgi:glycosyltransferase involved in cell wall biosynthesis
MASSTSMLKNLAKSKPITIGIECESIENDTYGVARLISKLLEQLAAQTDHSPKYRFVLYFNKNIPALPFLNNPIFEKRVVGLPRWGLPGSFSVYYYLLLPLQLWKDRPAAMYYPNYMLPLIHPPHVPSLVMMTEDIFREARNPKLAFRFRIAYLIFSLFWAVHRATKVMAISRSSRDALAREGIARDRIAVNELAVDTPATRHSPLATRHSLLYVGQAFERRHVREVLAAFTHLAQEMPDLSFHIVGPDKYEPPIIKETVQLLNQRLNRTAVSWEPYASDEDLATHYATARALVYVSDAEAFGLPPLEGLSHGAVPVVADAPVSREIYGPHAFYASQPSVTAIGTALRAALTDENHRTAIRHAAPAILARYTWKAHADRFLRIVQTLTR